MRNQPTDSFHNASDRSIVVWSNVIFCMEHYFNAKHISYISSTNGWFFTEKKIQIFPNQIKQSKHEIQNDWIRLDRIIRSRRATSLKYRFEKKTIVFEPNYPLCAILDEKLRCCTTYTETKTKAIRRRRKSSIWWS